MVSVQDAEKAMTEAASKGNKESIGGELLPGRAHSSTDVFALCETLCLGYSASFYLCKLSESKKYSKLHQLSISMDRSTGR